MIKVWTDGTEAGLLDRSGERGSTFVRQRYSVDAMVDGMIAVYRQQMEGH